MSEALSEEQVEEQVQIDPGEQKARETGWVSKEEFDANPDNEGKEWRDWNEYNIRGEFIGEINGLKKQLGELQGSTRELIREHGQAVKQETEARMRAELAQAVEDGDAQRAQKVADDIKELNQPAEPEVPYEAKQFIERNSWYGSDPERTAYAQTLDQLYSKENPSDLHAHFDRIEKEVQARFPEKYGNPNRERTPAAETTVTRRKNGPQVPALSSLSEHFQKAGRRFIAQGLYKDEAEYVKELMEQGAIDV